MSCPQDYLSCMIYMMKEIEKLGFSINNVFPMRNDIIPKHIRLDTTTLVHLLITINKARNENINNITEKGNKIIKDVPGYLF